MIIPVNDNTFSMYTCVARHFHPSPPFLLHLCPYTLLLYVMYYVNTKTYLSLLNLMLTTGQPNESSITSFFNRSSQMYTKYQWNRKFTLRGCLSYVYFSVIKLVFSIQHKNLFWKCVFFSVSLMGYMKQAGAKAKCSI